MAVTSCLGFYCSLQLSTAIAAYVSFLMLIKPLTYQTHSKWDKTSAHVELINEFVKKSSRGHCCFDLRFHCLYFKLDVCCSG